MAKDRLTLRSILVTGFLLAGSSGGQTIDLRRDSLPLDPFVSPLDSAGDVGWEGIAVPIPDNGSKETIVIESLVPDTPLVRDLDFGGAIIVGDDAGVAMQEVFKPPYNTGDPGVGGTPVPLPPRGGEGLQ